MDPEKLNRRPRGRRNLQRGKEANHKRLLNIESKLRVYGEGSKGEGKMGDGH